MNSAEAENHLKMIRRLMEWAVVYRGVSGAAAFIAGLFAVGLTALGLVGEGREGLQVFVWAWVALLGLCTALNLICLAREARRRGERMLTAAFRSALFAVAPPLIAGAAVTIFAVLSCWSAFQLTTAWQFIYAPVLLSTAHFAPVSVIRLGWAFLAVGILQASVLLAGFSPRDPLAWISMAGTFGVFHIVYGLAVCVGEFPKGRDEPVASP